VLTFDFYSRPFVSLRGFVFICVSLQLVSPELFIGYLTIWLNLSEGGSICGCSVFLHHSRLETLCICSKLFLSKDHYS